MSATLFVLVLGLGSAPPSPREAMKFIGFSKNEEVAAWRVARRAERADGSVDFYELARVVSTTTGEVLGEFRLSGVTREGRGGRRSTVPDRVAAREHPDWAEASSAAAWGSIRRRGGFGMYETKFSDGAVRLALDDDIDVTVDEREAKKVILKAAQGSAIGFRPVVRLYDGRQIPLGRFRAEGDARASADATIVAHHSRTGMHVAISARFSDGRDPKRDASLGGVFRLPGSPIATTEIGVFNAVRVNELQAHTIYEMVHPESYKYYKQYIEY